MKPMVEVCIRCLDEIISRKRADGRRPFRETDIVASGKCLYTRVAQVSIMCRYTTELAVLQEVKP